jgi:hypothetical protein
MKKLIFTLLLLSSTSVMAQDIRIFTGKYLPVNCPKSDRTYIEIDHYSNYSKLSIMHYSEDPSGEYITISPGKRQFPNTEEEIHGKITQENFLNWLSPTHLVIRSQTINKGRAEPVKTLIDLQLKGDHLIIKDDEEDSNPCILKKVRL